MRGTWQTTGGGGENLVMAAAVIVTALVAVPVLTALTAVINALIVAMFIVIGVALAGGVVLVVYRVRHPPALRALPPHVSPAAAVQAGRPRAIEGGQQLHLHFHGMSPEAVAAALRDARISE